MDTTTTDNKTNGQQPRGSSLILPGKLQVRINYDFSSGRIDCQIEPADTVSFSQVISILGQLVTTFAQQNMQAESRFFAQQAELLKAASQTKHG